MSSHVKSLGLRLSIQWLVAGLALLLFCQPAFSQLNLGRILGTVNDSTGGAMAGAKVTVTDQERGVSRVLTTDEAGAFAAPSLIPGNYSVRVEATGFNTAERKDVIVQVGSDARVDIVMQAGSQTQTVTVSEALPLINTTSATLGGVMENREVTDLPVIGRNWLQFLQLTPGVNSKPGGGSNAHASNGMRSDGNNYLFEGIFSGGVRTAGNIVNTNSSSGDGASLIPPDAIQEVGVNFQNKAEYGWRPGVAANVGVKSGTNTIHGTAFAQGQTSILNARNEFTPPGPKPELSYEQYGATVGGPIKKDKLFWFAAFEGMQFTQGTPSVFSVPTTALVAGNNSQSIPAAYQDLVAKAKIPAAAIDANGKVVNSALLNPQQQFSAQLVNAGIFQTGIPDSSGNFNYGFTSLRDPNKNVLGKVDWVLNDKNHITGEYFWSHDTELDNSNTVVQPYWLTDYYLTSNVTRATWTYVPNSTWVNEFHFGFDRKVENQWPSECVPGRAAAAPNYGPLNTGLKPCDGSPNASQNALFDIGIQNFQVNTTGAAAGNQIITLGGGGGQRRVEGYWTVDNIVSHTTGNHNVKFGFEIRRPYFDGAMYTGKLGDVTFGTGAAGGINAFAGATPLEDFLMGFPSNGTYVAGNPRSLTRNWNYGLFGQDDWRVTPRITFNLGLRWEYETALTEDSNAIAIFDPTSPIGLTQLGNGVTRPWNPNGFRKNMQPRLGMAWDVTGKGTTVLRAAYGLYSSWPVYSAINGGTSNPTAANFVTANGTVIPGNGTIGTATVSFPTSGTGGTPLINWTAAGPMFPTGTISCSSASPCAITAVDQHWRMPYVQEWNIGLQRAIGSHMSLDLAYVGTHGTDLFGQTDLNEATAGTAVTARVQQSRPYFNKFPWMGKITNVGNVGFSNYNALQATLTQRAWHGLFTTLGYTYSHALDTAGTDVGLSICPDPTVGCVATTGRRHSISVISLLAESRITSQAKRARHRSWRAGKSAAC